MSRTRHGSAFVKHGRITLQVQLRAGAPRRFWTCECPPRKDGVPVDLVHARAAAADLQRLYDAGKWDPLAPKVDAPAASAPPPPPPATVREHADAWAKGQTYESAPKDRKVLAKYLRASELGGMLVRDLRPMHIAAWIDWLRTQPSTRTGLIAARSIRNIYDALRRALDDAVLHEILPANPCAVVHGKLPSIEDKDAGARDGWFFERAEVWAMITDPRVIEPRRVLYAVEFMTGCRPGEAAALRLRDWDRTQRPLTRLTLTRAIKSVSKKEGRTKTGARKFVPVHPALEKILNEWVVSGWDRLMGRAPTPDDLLCPNQNGEPRNTNRMNRDFGRDLAKLKFRERHHYCTRHTFISQTQEDGGDSAILRWATHAPPKTAYDGYTRGQWSRLCAEVLKLQVGPASSEESATAGGSTPAGVNRGVNGLETSAIGLEAELKSLGNTTDRDTSRPFETSGAFFKSSRPDSFPDCVSWGLVGSLGPSGVLPGVHPRGAGVGRRGRQAPRRGVRAPALALPREALRALGAPRRHRAGGERHPTAVARHPHAPEARRTERHHARWTAPTG